MSELHHSEGAAPDAHELDHHLAHYKKIIVALALMTGVEFGISYMMSEKHLGFVAGVILLVGLAFVKAGLVAKFFMHLRYDPRLLGLLCCTPLVLATPLNIICIFDACKGPSI